MGFLPITRDQYVSLLDFLGPIIRQGKRGVIPPDLAPIWKRLGVQADGWVENFLESFRRHKASRDLPRAHAVG